MSLCGFTSESRLRRPAEVRSALVLLVVAVFLVASPTAGAKRRDHTPPTFAGLKSATTCVPGPIGGGRTTSSTLRWDAATDKVSPSSTIVYLVYQANAPGSEDFSTPTYTTAAGRARDRRGRARQPDSHAQVLSLPLNGVAVDVARLILGADDEVHGLVGG